MYNYTVKHYWNVLNSSFFQLDETARVSPGHLNGEQNFINKITGVNANYLLPEYVTGLLLSRNVNIEFKDISASQSAHAVRVSTSNSFSVGGSFGFWGGSVSGSFRSSRSERTFSAESSSDGLRISIPGAQIIGYYTQVLPKFPKDVE